MFDRFFGAGNSSPRERPVLSRHHTDVLNNCIKTTRTEIFVLERRMEALNSDIMTVCRCIRERHPPFTPPIAVRLPEPYQEAASTPGQQSPKKSPRTCQYFPRLRSNSPPKEPDPPGPASFLIERPVDIPGDERVVTAPISISPEDMTSMTEEKADPQVTLNLLVLKKAELEVNVEKLECDLSYWGELYEQVRVVYRQGMKEMDKSHPYYKTKRQSSSSPLAEPSSSADHIPGEHDENSHVGASRRYRIPRKEVPVKEMIARVKATSKFSSRPGLSRQNSWYNGDEILLPNGRESVDIGIGSSSELQYTVPTTPEPTRGDSGIDMSADIEQARAELEGIM